MVHSCNRYFLGFSFLRCLRNNSVFAIIIFLVADSLFLVRHLRLCLIDCIFHYTWFLSIHTSLWLLQGFIHFIGFFNEIFFPNLSHTPTLSFSCFFFLWISKLLFELYLCTPFCWLCGLLLVLPFSRLSFLLSVWLQSWFILFNHIQNEHLKNISLAFLIIYLTDLWVNLCLGKHDVSEQGAHPHVATSIFNRWAFQFYLFYSFFIYSWQIYN